MNYKKICIVAGIVLLVVLGVKLVFPKSAVFGGYGPQTAKSYTTSSTTSITIGNQESLIVAPQSGQRGYLIFSNPTATTQYLCFASTCTVGTGILLVSSSTYEVTLDNLYTGTISGRANASSSIIITELRIN